MFPKGAITLAVAILWAVIEDITAFIPFAQSLGIFWWLSYGIIMWFAVFWFVDAVNSRPKAVCDKPKATGKQVLASFALRTYLWIPLILLGYFLLRTVEMPAFLRFGIWYAKVLINVLLMFRLRAYLVKRYCALPPDRHSASDKPQI